MTDRELIQMARDALAYLWDGCPTDEALVERLDARLAQPEPEPVAWMTHHDNPLLFPTNDEALRYCNEDEEPQPLYTAPPQREWQGLTDEEMREALLATGGWRETVRAIEAKLKEKNT